MSKPIKCKWCCGTGTTPASGGAPAHRCSDCGGRGEVWPCEGGCGKLLAWNEGVLIGDDLWCNECAEGDDDAT